MIEKEEQRRYAAVVLDAGLGVGKGTLLRIGGEPPQRQLIHVIAEEAYRRGAAFVRVEYDDVPLSRIRADASHDEYLDAVLALLRKDGEIFAQEGWSMLRIEGYENASTMEGADHARLTRIQRARSIALKALREAQMASRIPWCVVPAPTDAWARTVFGDTGTAERLWKTLTPILRLDAPNPAMALRKHMDGLDERARALNGLEIRALRFMGPGTDLRVALSPDSIWVGGADATPAGKAFMPNIPTEEVFTNPDYRGTEGSVSTTRRARIHGAVVEGARLEFRAGEVVSCSAARGGDALERFLETDAGARRLGEVALVDTESPIWKSGLVFDSMLLDENAACHIALGSGYDSGFKGAEKLDDDGKAARGFNTSYVHEDLMVGSAEVSVIGTDSSGRERPLVTQGRFVI